MPLQLFQAQVERIRDLTHDVREIELRLKEPPAIAFKAGQFVSFEVGRDALNRTIVRPYSIASPPSQRERVLLLLNLVQGGPGSTYLFSLRVGDETQFKGPTGAFYLRDDPARDLLFVATATGIAPLRSMLYALSERGFPRPVTLYWGLRSQRGRVTPLVEARIASVQNLAVYLCGNEGMIKDVTAVLQKKGLCPIYREKYY
ncbi:MAG: hypothetical protein E6K62_10095 [Nitrospirae bacterium]|nr:MAG: hypothetical protein E6K62_10095 [Nitrospirota bacterium]